MQNITEDYQKILEFICKLEDVDDLKHLFEYLDNFWQTQFATAPVLIFSKAKNGKEAYTRDFWNRGKDEIYYNGNEVEEMKQAVTNADGKELFYKSDKFENTIYTLNCGVYKTQRFYICFKINYEIADNVLEYFHQFMATTLKKIGRYKEADNLKSLVHIDDVTGLYNQRKFLLDIEYSIAEYEKLKKPFSLIFVDIDHFKQVNDGHGHLVGSSLLKDVSKIIRDTVRDEDLCYRYGGDEFVILIPFSNYEEANIVATRVLKNIKDETFTVEEGEGIGDASEFKLSVSIGIANFPKDAKNQVDIINMADKMMYKAKQSGRGKICSAAELIGTDEEGE
ncbi:GGDEF domain-containing protein [Bacteriovorax sp. DB6_IX]|uniref:GGDEF domain-containing protein n=1 Tax=Bacteriovorax sp. DB6_IX TaxID=1353530 RepID=UPI000389F3B6|nr:GGDEF domain-containing protein [Bacteriovorax sp. DB6_IX]EQC51139.1 diguanylate cyclase (GGDEF) domain protein [Bacteriovorax sp. DB6_IX]